MRTNIIINLQIEGVHKWGSIDPHTMSHVDYLQHIHRHTFHICAKLPVSHDDRDKEIIEFKSEIETYLNKQYSSDKYTCLDFGSKSCEMLARELMTEFNLSYCSVIEDGENGAEIIA